VRGHLLSQHVDQQQGCIAFWAMATQTDSTAIQIAVRAATLPDATLTTAGALVDRLRDDGATSLELLTEALQIWRTSVVAETESVLLVGTRAIAGARGTQGFAADEAARATITRTVTHGRLARRRHGWSSPTRCLGASLAR
jgi:hypothetical protein